MIDLNELTQNLIDGVVDEYLVIEVMPSANRCILKAEIIKSWLDKDVCIAVLSSDYNAVVNCILKIHNRISSYIAMYSLRTRGKCHDVSKDVKEFTENLQKILSDAHNGQYDSAHEAVGKLSMTCEQYIRDHDIYDDVWM